MDHFTYEHGALRCEGVAVADIAATVGTPCYVYSAGTLAEHLRRTREAFAALDPLILSLIHI